MLDGLQYVHIKFNFVVLIWNRKYVAGAVWELFVGSFLSCVQFDYACLVWHRREKYFSTGKVVILQRVKVWQDSAERAIQDMKILAHRTIGMFLNHDLGQPNWQQF